MTTVEGSIDTLSRAIMSEAQDEINEVKSQSQSRADAILQRAEAAAAQQKAAIIGKARQEARRLKEQATATAQLKARTLELEHREQLLQKIFDTAADRLGALARSKDYGETLLALLREALDQLHSDAAVIRADATSETLLTESVLKRISQDAGIELRLGETLQKGTGILVQTEDGRLQFDNTLENRLERLRVTLRADVFRILTGDLP